MSERLDAAYLSLSKSNKRLSPLILLIRRVGPSPSLKARLNALIRPTGFFRFSTLKKSKLKRNVKPSGKPTSLRDRFWSTAGRRIGKRNLLIGLGAPLSPACREANSPTHTSSTDAPAT